MRTGKRERGGYIIPISKKFIWHVMGAVAAVKGWVYISYLDDLLVELWIWVFIWQIINSFFCFYVIYRIR